MSDQKEKLETIKKLREMTGVGFSDCKSAIEETGGDIDKAVEFLRKKGIAKASKKMSRTANEGLVLVHKENNGVSLLEVNSETDFVAKNKDFINFCEEALKVAVDTSSEENLLDEVSERMEKQRMALVQKIGENIIIRKVKKITGEVLDSYIHSNKKIAAGVSLEQGSPEIAKDVAMHIAASNPIVLSPEDLDESYINSEREIFKVSAIARILSSTDNLRNTEDSWGR